jgi:membrane-bound lytic murein transglycosylase B
MKSETEPQHNAIVRYLKLWVETIQYIRLHGWAEYRKARERYDKHQNAIQNIESRYSKVREIKRANQLMKLRK